MAGAPPGAAGAPVDFVNTDEVNQPYDVRRHGTPTRRLQPEDGGDHGQPAEAGGSLAMSHANEVARVLRNEMSALRIAVEASIAGMKRDYDVKLSGRDFTGAIKQIGDNVVNLEQELSHIRHDWI